MDIDQLQQYSVRMFTGMGRLLKRLQDWIFNHPRLSNWVFRSDGQVDFDRYAENNRWVFAQYAEQERMLADKPRMQFYHEMIRRHITAGDRVVDLGTGTGILAAFASWQGAGKVYALDHSAIIDEARALASHNKITNVEFLAKHSTVFDVEQPVDVILHEQMGDVLFDEDMVTNVLDLRDRILKKGGKILPARFEFYVEPVQVREDCAVPFIWELVVDGFDFSPLEVSQPEDRGYYTYSSTDPTLVDRFLCDPTPLMSINLETMSKAELAMEWSLALPVVRSGRMDGYAVYFRALVDDDLILSTSPLDEGRAPHWGFRILRTERMEVAEGDVIDMTISADNWPNIDSWRWQQGKYTAEQYRDCMYEGDDDDEDEEAL